MCTFLIPGSVLYREIEGEAVVLSLDTGRYHLLDPVGTRMWCALTGSKSVEHAEHALLEEFAVAPEVLRRDLRCFMDDLAARGLLDLSES